MTAQQSKTLQSFQWTHAETPILPLVRAIADLSGTTVTDLQPIYETIDGDALDRMFAPTRGPDTRINGSVSFEYEGYWVQVKANGRGYVFEDQPSENTSQNAEVGISQAD